MTAPHKVTIRAGLDGGRSEIKVDGKTIQALRFQVEGGPHMPTRVTVTFFADVVIDGVAEVTT